ncbi:MAG: hypothetical protein IPM54_11605 [Polyangiaceae bacterium]|nr:hypothetical protein [Polyangiaceae bacterium]
MADEHIDYLEVFEYGDHFLVEIDKLDGLTNIVNIAAVKADVASAMTAVATELEKQGIKRSGVRSDRKDVTEKTAALRKNIDKFYHYTSSLDDDEPCDVDAFFPGGNLGAIASLKPADLSQRAGDILRGFAVETNKNLPDAAKWKPRIETAKAELDAAISGKGSSTGQTIQGTAALVAARQAFLTAYNGVAKRAIQAVLIKLGRKDEMRLFFKDLQVNESSKGAPVNTTTEGT